jgi:pentose-5-phosphate-3-epimerase
MKTIPSILEKDASSLFYQINKLSPYFPRFQIDIADGIFVSNKTVQIDEIIDNVRALRAMPQQIFDFHLMVKDYEKEIKKLERLRNLLKINYIFIHFDLLPNYQLLTTDYSFPIGLVLNPQDQIDNLVDKYDLNKIPFIQIMSVNPGFQGSPFLNKTLNKIEQLRDIGYRKEIFLDGAINKKTIPIILSKKYQSDFICPGSYLTKTDKLKERTQYLKKL